jgi:hypothetical protein
MAAMPLIVIYKQRNMSAIKTLTARPRNANFMFYVCLRLAYIAPYSI